MHFSLGRGEEQIMTTLTLLPLPIIALGIFFILRFWHALNLLGFRSEVLRRDSSLATADLVAVCTGSAFIVGDDLRTRQRHLAAPALRRFRWRPSIVRTHLYARTNHATTWAATRIEALRTVAALRLISAAELVTRFARSGLIGETRTTEHPGGPAKRAQQAVREER